MTYTCTPYFADATIYLCHLGQCQLCESVPGLWAQAELTRTFHRTYDGPYPS